MVLLLINALFISFLGEFSSTLDPLELIDRQVGVVSAKAYLGVKMYER